MRRGRGMPRTYWQPRTGNSPFPECSDLEVEPLPNHSPVRRGIEPVQPRRAVGDAALGLVELLEQSHAEDLLAEVALVERVAEGGLVQALERREGELLREELEADR